jgi:hypothetical protein
LSLFLHHAGFLASLKNTAINETRKFTVLFLYLSIWFSALVFLSNAILRANELPLMTLSFALVKAALCAKFMLVGQSLFPMALGKGRPIFWILMRHSVVYLVVALALSFFESGLEGLFHHQPFFESLLNFEQGDPYRLAATSFIYWLIILPYLVFVGMREELGYSEVSRILFGTTDTATVTAPDSGIDTQRK